jgi:hypothetical protein
MLEPMPQQVRDLSACWFQAWLDKDAESIERLARRRRLRYVSPNGSALPANDSIGARARRSWSVNSVPDAAAVPHHNKARARLRAPSSSTTSAASMVWEKQAGRWRLVMTQCALNSK